MKTLSFGGLGDSFIVCLKLRQILHKENLEKIEHTFVESNEKTCELIKEFSHFFCRNVPQIETKIECDPLYQENFYKGKWRGQRTINTSIRGDYHFPAPDFPLEDNFAHYPMFPQSISSYNVCIQAAAGVGSNRCWRFNPLILKYLLESKGLSVSLVGTAQQFVEKDNLNNFICKTSIKESMKIVHRSKILISPSGFHSFHALAKRIPVIHFQESEIHNKHYLHPEWKYYNVELGSLKEVMDGLRHWKIL